MIKIFTLIYKIIYNILDFINNLIIDIKSWRNFLVVLTFLMCLITIYLKSDAVVITACISCWTIILNKYLEERSKNQMIETQINALCDKSQEKVEEIVTQVTTNNKSIFKSILGWLKSKISGV